MVSVLGKLLSLLRPDAPPGEERVNSPLAIEPTPKQIAAELQMLKEMMSFIEYALREADVIEKHKLSAFVERLRSQTHPFARFDPLNAFNKRDCLSVREKRLLGLNTRMKYARDFISFFESEALRKIEPKSFIDNLCLDAFHRANRQKNLAHYRELGFIKKVKIVPIYGCGKVKMVKKIYGLDDAPALPLEGCDSCCMCDYEPVLPR